eukprot:5161420-Prymnesium_polylepis.1
MGTHARLGQMSPLRVLPPNVLEKVLVYWMMAEAFFVSGLLWDDGYWIDDDDDVEPTSSSK